MSAKKRLPRRRTLISGVKESARNVVIDEIPYSEVLNALLFAQLRTHLKFLSKFRELFRFFDLENYGYITRDSFSEMLEILDITDRAELEDIYAKLEKNLSNTVTFTDLVVQFSNHMMSGDGEKITLLQFICDNDNRNDED